MTTDRERIQELEDELERAWATLRKITAALGGERVDQADVLEAYDIAVAALAPALGRER